MRLSNKSTFSLASFLVVLMALGLVFAGLPALAHDGDHPVNENILGDNPATADTVETDFVVTAAHNGHPEPEFSTDDDTSTKTDGKDGNRIRIVEVADDTTTTGADENENTISRTFTLLVDFDGTTVVGQSDLMAIEMDTTATPPVETADSIPDLTFTTLLLDKNGALLADTTGISSGAIDAGNITVARVEGSDSQILVTIVLPVAAVPDGYSDNGTTTPDGLVEDKTTLTAAANLEEITLRIRVNPTAADATDGVFSLATRPGFDVVPGGRMMMRSDLLELTLVADIGDEPAPTAAVVKTIDAGSLNADDEVDFTITFDKALIASQTFTLGDVEIAGGRAVDFVPQADGMTFILTVIADDRTEPITVTVGDMSETSDPEMVDPDIPDLVLRIVAPIAPNADGKLVFTITSNVALDPALSIHDFDIDTREVEELASGDLVMSETPPEGIEEQYMLTVTPKAGVTSVLVELRAGASMYMRDHDDDPETDPVSTQTPTREALYSPEEGKPTIGEIMAMNLDDSMLAATPGDIDSIDGGKITVSASDAVDGDLTSQIGNDDIVVERGTRISSVSNGSFTVIPDIGATTVKITVKADAVTDNAGNTNAAKSATFNVGPTFTIAKDTILVITKTMGVTHQYLSDQPRLPINAQPPTPAPNIQTDVWHNMPDLEVLFNLSFTNGGTLNLTEAPGQAELPQTRDGNKNQRNAVRISEVMWASDLSKRGGLNDEEAAQQWIEISNDTGSAVTIFLFARTGRDSAINVDDVEDRIGNAYDGSIGNAAWTVPGQNGNSYTGIDFISMHRSYVGGDNRGYVNGMSKGHWHASDREYRTLDTGNPNDGAEYHYIGSPGRPHSFSVKPPDTRKGVTQVPSSPFIINEVANRDAGNSQYEWIEIKNVTDSTQNLRNYLISVVTATDHDNVLVQLDNRNYNVPAGRVVLVLTSDPRYDDDHPIAVGYNMDIDPPSDQVDGLGLIVEGSKRQPPLQIVQPFERELPNDNTGRSYVLILRRPDNYEGHRSGNDGKGVAETGEKDVDKIVDIAGHHEGLSKSNYPASTPAGLNSTTLWPLVNFNGDMRPHRGHGDWNHRRHNALDVNRVRYRQHHITKHANDANRGTPGNRAGTGTTHHDEGHGHYAFRDANYTGLGYKRTARTIGVHNGTPGYDGNTIKPNDNDVKSTANNVSVAISEIMLSTGPNETLPQWIELYNSSHTDAVNLQNWKLRFEMLDENGDPMDSLMDLEFNKSRSVKTIQPRQTVLIVAGNARQANSDSKAGIDVFNENRVFNVQRDVGLGKFGANTRYQFFNPKAFHMALLDRDGKVVDAFGNLDGDARTSDKPDEGTEFPPMIAEDGNRSSIIRIYDDGTGDNDHTNDGNTWSEGVPRDGMGLIMPLPSDDNKLLGTMGIDMKYSWIPAVNVLAGEHKVTIRSTWYGDEDDYGTPNNRPGMVLPVELSFFRPTLEDGKVTVRWTTESELDNAGFNILRSKTRSGEYTQVNAELIQGAGTTGERTTYSWVDTTAKPGVVYYYQIEDVSFAGERQALAVTKLKGLISAENKLTTTWSKLKEASQ